MMISYDFEKSKLNAPALRGEYPNKDDATIGIHTPAVVKEHGKKILIYDVMEWSHATERAIRSLQELEEFPTFEANGITLGRLYCKGDNWDETDMGIALARLGLEVDAHYRRSFPDEHQSQSDSVKEMNRIPGTAFNTIVVNKNNRLPYHFDSQNIKNAISCLVIFRHEIIGGDIYFPQYNLKIRPENRSILMFRGQDLLHGVSPIDFLSANAYRYSILFYAFKPW